MDRGERLDGGAAMRYLSVCSGIEAATVAWDPLGFEPVALSEVEPFPSEVLAQHYPDIPNLGDMTQIDGSKYRGSMDLIVGGTPCQSFSVAGLRGGMADPRGNLALAFLGLVDTIRPKYFVWENVPGVLSSSGGRDFGSFVSAVAQLGYRGAWRVLDAQYFGLAQRRKRVFFVGCSPESGVDPREILFERESLRGDSPPSREARQEATGGVTHSLRGEGLDASEDGTGRGTPLISHALNAKGGVGRHDPSVETYIPTASHWDGDRPHPTLNRGGVGGIGMSNQEIFSQRGGGLVPAYGVDAEMNARDEVRLMGGDGKITGALAAEPGAKQQTYIAAIQERAVCENPAAGPDGAGFKDDGAAYTLEARTTPQAVALNAHQDPDVSGDISHPLGSKDIGHGVPTPYAVRRLTPVECERLQGFPDNYTRIPWKGKGPEDCPDGPRYKALGNSMAVPVMRWIGKRLTY